MKHRHLAQSDYSAPAIDDIIARGRRDDWVALANAMHDEPSIRETVKRVCQAYLTEPGAQRYHFWKHYAELRAAA